jgi:hypothetical protein
MGVKDTVVSPVIWTLALLEFTSTTFIVDICDIEVNNGKELQMMLFYFNKLPGPDPSTWKQKCPCPGKAINR